MNFDAPIPFSQALQIIAAKLTTPTNQSSAFLSSTLSRDVRAMSLFSARTTNAAYLEEIRAVCQKMVNGEINEATARQELQLWLDKIGYSPGIHFGDDATIPPADPGALRDLSSDKRIKLVLQTNVRLAANTAFMTAGMDPDALDMFPCWELVRIYPRLHPRGSTDAPHDLGWPQRWIRAGGKLVQDRMIARKDDPIWQNLGNSGIFPDGTDSDAPPYAYESGMGLREVPRQECIALGAIDDGETVGPKPPSLLGDFFDGHPERATLADLQSTRSDILGALAELGRAA